MVVRKVTVSLEESAYEAAVRAARAAGVSLSAWLSGYATHRARIDEGLRAVAAYEAEYGAVPVADTVLDEMGVGSPVPPARDDEFTAALDSLRSRQPRSRRGAGRAA